MRPGELLYERQPSLIFIAAAAEPHFYVTDLNKEHQISTSHVAIANLNGASNFVRARPSP
jgi:hypothetical protein